MRYRWLGNTGLKVSEIGFGAWAIGGAWWGPQDDMDSKLALHQALDMGCQFIDTAWVYGNGHSEKLIGGVLQERRQRPILASKIPPKNWNWDNKPGTPLSEAYPSDWVVSKTEESLRNLGVDCLDVQQMHTWLQSWNNEAGPLLAAIQRLKRDGKIRAFGISLRDKGPGEANDLIRWRQVDTLQIFFNLFYQEPIREVFPLARQYGVGVIARVPLAFGALSGRFTPHTKFFGDDHRQRLYVGEGLTSTLKKVVKLKYLSAKMPLAEAAMKWTLSYPEVSTCIPGIRNQRQSILNCGAGEGAVLPLALARKAEKLYKVNFNLPLRVVSPNQDIPAVFISGVKREPLGKNGGRSLGKKKKPKAKGRRESVKRRPSKKAGKKKK